MTAERIRDKIAASKARGMWMGGTLPLGYDLPVPGSRALVINEEEAKTVRYIFQTYLELCSVYALEKRLAQEHIHSKRYVARNGRQMGGKTFSRGSLFHLLRNRTYLGLIPHGQEAYPGLHDPIVESDLFRSVQAALDTRAMRLRAKRDRVAAAPLVGRIFDIDGNPMSPTFSYGKYGRLYRYYVSAPLQKGKKRPQDDTAPRRVSAPRVEGYLSRMLQSALGEHSRHPMDLVTRITVSANTLDCRLPIGWLQVLQAVGLPGASVAPDPEDSAHLNLQLPFAKNASHGWVTEETPDPGPDSTLVEALRTAHALVQWDSQSQPTIVAAPDTPHRRKLIRLALLAPNIQHAILEGRHPAGLTLAKLLAVRLPVCWRKQAEMLDFD